MYFFGEKIEKIGPKKYRITNGGFSTCVQPTPRWDLHAGTVVLNVDHYTLLTNAVLRVKGVPMFYMPILYYPTKRDDRATGFLMPTYGSSSLRGQSIHNAFFWAINRSQDATFMHDWFSKTGQGVGSEYRYNAGSGDGNIRAYLDDQHGDDLYARRRHDQSRTPRRAATRSAAAPTSCCRSACARAATSTTSRASQQSQTFNTNIYDASRNSRSFGGNVVGAWGKYSLNATIDHSEYFYDAQRLGTWPAAGRASRSRATSGRSCDSPVYFSVGAEFVSSLRARTAKSPTTTAPTSITVRATPA